MVQQSMECHSLCNYQARQQLYSSHDAKPGFSSIQLQVDTISFEQSHIQDHQYSDASAAVYFRWQFPLCDLFIETIIP